ncbi:hypothetical protein HYU82_02480 [Candidatus Saccharibacteria bacterium]|nr:hypothetical protein [Candidatus Saccharibacteria bacterium]
MEREAQTIETRQTQLASELYDRGELELRAWKLIQNRERIEHDSWEREPEINARTAIFEELTAKGHLSRVEFEEQPDQVNTRALRRLINAWSDRLPGWEQERRFHEIVEELTVQQVWEDIKSGNLPEDTVVITISNFPEQATSGKEARNNGYRTLNCKGMVRTTEFTGGRRVIEQVSRSNSNDQSSRYFFAANGLYVEESSSVAFLSSQVIATKRNFPDGVVDVQRALDSFVGPNILYGEDRYQLESHVPEYEDLRAVSAERETQADSHIQRLAGFEEHLNIVYKQGKLNYSQKQRLIYQERKRIVDEICLLDPSYAKDARGEISAKYFKQAGLAVAAGDDASAINYLESALRSADPDAGVVCGGDGIEQIEDATKQEAEQLLLKAKEARKNWKWKSGVCAVKECPTRPQKVKVGPCSVCRKCQKIFDNGDKPKTVYGALGLLDILLEAFMQSKSEKESEKLKKAI